jgi:hypothetical protein
VVQYQAEVLTLEIMLLWRNTANARAMLHYLLRDWRDFPGEMPSAADQARIVRDGLLAQQRF